MFKRVLTPVAIALCALTAGLTNADSANAKWASFVIQNTSSVSLHYTVEWSDGQVDNMSIAPGQMLFHAVTLNEYGLIPTPYIMFDAVAGDDGYTSVTYEFDAYVVEDPAIGGKGYSFVFSTNGVSLDLYAD